MSPDIGRIAFRIATFLVVVSAGLLFVVTPGSAEFIVTAITLAVGVIFGVLIIIVVRMQQ